MRTTPIFLIFFGVINGAKEKNQKEIAKEFEYDRAEHCLLDLKDAEDNELKYTTTNLLAPIVDCRYLPPAFITCDDPIPLFGPGQTGPPPANDSYRTDGKCLKMGGYLAEEVDYTWVKCRPLPCIECHGERVFRKRVPCIIYTGYYFLTTLLYSIFLGVVAVDRFYLGYSAMAVGKLMTLGGFGVWWIIDIVLLVTGNLGPADDSNWEPYY